MRSELHGRSRYACNQTASRACRGSRRPSSTRRRTWSRSPPGWISSCSACTWALQQRWRVLVRHLSCSRYFDMNREAPVPRQPGGCHHCPPCRPRLHHEMWQTASVDSRRGCGIEPLHVDTVSVSFAHEVRAVMCVALEGYVCYLCRLPAVQVAVRVQLGPGSAEEARAEQGAGADARGSAGGRRPE